MIIQSNEKKNDSNYSANWQDILYSARTFRLISDLSKFSADKCLRARTLFLQYCRKTVEEKSIVWLCSQLKIAERNILLGRIYKPTRLPFRKMGLVGLPEQIVLVFLSIHRNMNTKPKINLSSIKHRISDFNVEAITSVKNRVFKALVHGSFGERIRKLFKIRAWADDYVKYGTRLKTTLHRYHDNPYTCDPTIDTNGRTGGHVAPIQVSWKKRTNGSCFDSHNLDYNAIKETNPALFQALQRVWSEWNYDLRDSSFLKDQNHSNVISRIHGLPDSSCKTRMIAIFDSLSQIALRPVHLMLEDIMRKLPCDYTFDHLGGVREMMIKFKDKMCYSVDISAATDTIPRDLSFRILDYLITPQIVKIVEPSQFVKDIKTIMIDRLFHYDGGAVRYSIGQPMGAYASFPLLAITNHILVWLAALDSGLSDFSDYGIVGDDVVIANEKVALTYISLLESLGIPINQKKLVVGAGTFEFCRRIVSDGTIKSVVSINAYYRSITNLDPVPLMILLNQYGIRIPFEVMCQYFRRKDVRTALYFHDFVFTNDKVVSKVDMLPNDVVSHGVRCIEILDTLKRGIPKKLDTSDLFLYRLNYCIDIINMFNKSKFHEKWKQVPIVREVTVKKYDKRKDIWRESKKTIQTKVWRKSKKTAVWDIAHLVVANTFYLGYIYNYLNRNKLYKQSRSVNNSEAGHRLRLLSYIMSQKTKWITDKLFTVRKSKDFRTQTDWQHVKREV